MRQDVSNALVFAAAEMKLRHNGSHPALLMEVGDSAYIKLHKGYNLKGLENKKISNQRASPFKIIRRVHENAYELELPPLWKIHPVISVTMLKPAPKGEDPYYRPRDDGS